ncbi:MAG: MFS transporter [Eubacteriales bacterium]
MSNSVLGNKNYILVVLGRFVSDFGTYLQSFAMSLFVLKKTGSATLFAMVIVLSMIPRLILMPFAGVLADRISRKKMIVSMDILSGIFMLIAGGFYVARGDLSLPFIYVIVIILNTINVFFSPAMGSIMPDIVEKEKLADANSISEITVAINALIAPIVAGVLFGSFGILPIIIVNAVSFLISALSESFIKLEKESIVSKEKSDKFFVSFMQGVRYIKTMPEFLIIIGVAVIANFALAPIFSVALPIVILNDFGLSDSAYGIITALMTIGMLVGPLFAAGVIKKHHYSKLVSRILFSAGILNFIIAAMCIKGIFSSVYINTVLIVLLINILMVIIIWVNLSLTTARQRIVPGHLQGRVVSVMGMFAMAAMPLGQALMGYLLDRSEAYIIIAIYALLAALSGILARIGFSKLARSGKMNINQAAETTNDIPKEAAETV